jgi:selenocysteine-specific elongation factor
MRSVVIGTAGHIDHGKTTLVKALTGVDTDRLKEEKERGITIELGFAPIELPGGIHAGVVDVPGHERFVRTMVAGAGGIDAALLVVAASEGVMPQTREHLAVCQLLGIPAGVVALNKADLVEPDFLDLAVEDVRDTVKGTFLEDAPIVPVSATTGRGIDALREALATLVTGLAGRDPTGPLRLPIDRSFPMKGFGAVVTGTLVSGRIEVGQAIEILPSAIGAKVRGLQIHGHAVERADAGTRIAVNLQGVDSGLVPRWEWLTRAGELVPTRQIDARIRLLAGCTRPLKLRQALQLHVGTAAVGARVVLLDRTELPPGESALARLRLDAGIIALPGDRFILRGDDSLAPYGGTVGGGTVLRPLVGGYRRRADAAARATAFEESDGAGRVALELEWAGPGGLDKTGVFRRIAPDPGAAIAAAKKAGGCLEVEANRYVHPSVVGTVTRLALEAIARHHESRPLDAGMPRQELRSRLPSALPGRLFEKVVTDLAASGKIVALLDVVRMPTHRPQAKDAGGGLMESIARTLAKEKLQPPRVKELPDVVGASLADVKSALKLLVSAGRIVRVNDELYFDRSEIDRLRDAVVAFLRANGEIDAQRWKDLTGASRKFTIPIAEFFDAEKLTLRVGDVRRLRGGR